MSLIFDATSFSPHDKQLTGKSCGPVLACQETHSCSFEEGTYRYDLEVGKKDVSSTMTFVALHIIYFKFIKRIN